MGQVVPGIDPSHTPFQISHQIHTDLKDDQKSAKKTRICGQFHSLENTQFIPFPSNFRAFALGYHNVPDH